MVPEWFSRGGKFHLVVAAGITENPATISKHKKFISKTLRKSCQNYKTQVHKIDQQKIPPQFQTQVSKLVYRTQCHNSQQKFPPTPPLVLT